MKPNGKCFAVRVAILALCAAGLLTTLANAESVHGTFKLTDEAHWGKLLLTPGEYEFSMSKGTSGYMVTIRSKETGWGGMVMAEAISDARATDGTKLVLAKSQGDLYVQQFSLAEAGITLNYTSAKPGKLTRLTKEPAANVTMAAAAGAH